MLAILQHESETALKQAKAAKARLDGGLVLKYGEQAAEARRALPARIPAPSASMTATSPWLRTCRSGSTGTRRKLAAIVERIRAAGDEPAEYVETSFKVAERNYGAWPTAIREGFEPARTVRPGQLSIQLLADRVAE